jgi:hypothetical protein
MPAELPYVPSYGNLPKLLDTISKAKVPDVLSTRVLANVFGLKGTNDRPLIPLMKKLGFLDQAGKPTPEYGQLRGSKETAQRALAAAIRKAYEPLFAANELADQLTGEDLRGLIAQVTGADDRVVKAITGTFKALTKQADFSTPKSEDGGEKDNQKSDETEKRSVPQAGVLRADFHFNIQIHLPANGTEETYLSIFSALRRTFS